MTKHSNKKCKHDCENARGKKRGRQEPIKYSYGESDDGNG